MKRVPVLLAGVMWAVVLLLFSNHDVDLARKWRWGSRCTYSLRRPPFDLVSLARRNRHSHPSLVVVFRSRWLPFCPTGLYSMF